MTDTAEAAKAVNEITQRARAARAAKAAAAAANGTSASAAASPKFAPGVLVKFITFAIAVATLPIATYYYALDNWFPGDTMYSAICAAAAVNLIVLVYAVIAVVEGSTHDPEAEALVKAMRQEHLAKRAAQEAAVETKKDQ
ncbi:hypothetical protein GGF32_000744 [Allomyces javanicus]|nr:hypothetical protein GGF32_000744 [Allomyces javanicus]